MHLLLYLRDLLNIWSYLRLSAPTIIQLNIFLNYIYFFFCRYVPLSALFEILALLVAIYFNIFSLPNLALNWVQLQIEIGLIRTWKIEVYDTRN